MVSVSSHISVPTPKSLDFNILIMNEDSSELNSTERVYKRAIEKVKLENIVSDVFDIRISTADNENKAHRIIQTAYADNPDCFQIAHLPEIISGRRGEEFVDQIRREFEYKNFGAIMTVSDETQINETESRKYGVYGRVKKPLTVETIISPLHSVMDMVLLKSKPQKKEVKDLFLFRPLTGESELLEYYQKRFEVWSRLNYIPQEFKSPSGLEMDNYDKRSVPLGGFCVDNFEKLSIICRVVTPFIQQEFLEKTRAIIKEKGDDIVYNAFESNSGSKLPIITHCKKLGKEAELMQFIGDYGGLNKSVEYSRLMVADKKSRGSGLSTAMARFHNMYAKYVLGANLGLAECLTSHVPHNTSVNGFTGEITSLGTINGARADQQIGKGIYINLKNPMQAKQFENIYRVYAKYGFFCSCERNDCVDNGYKLDNSSECRRKVLGYEC